MVIFNGITNAIEAKPEENKEQSSTNWSMSNWDKNTKSEKLDFMLEIMAEGVTEEEFKTIMFEAEVEILLQK